MVGSVERTLDVSKQRVDPLELEGLNPGRSAAGDDSLVKAHGGEASQSVADNNAARAQMFARPGADFVFAEPAHAARAHRQRSTVVVGLDRGNERGLRFRASTALTSSFPAPIGVVELHDPPERPDSVPLLHRRHELVLHPRCAVAGQSEFARELQRPDAVFGLGQQTHCEEPHRERQLRILEQRTGDERGSMVAPRAFAQCPRVQCAQPRVVTLRANEPVGPTRSMECFGALLFSAVLSQKLPKTVSVLKLDRIAGHRDSPCDSKGSSMQRVMAH
ncbi:MAG: hypothetical protein ACI9W2_004106 [Gammaproteobacteria bacterium]|jgi:hypothetical protein